MSRAVLSLILALSLSACAGRRPEPAVGPLSVAEEQTLFECRRSVAARADARAAEDRQAAGRTGREVMRHYARGAQDPFLLVAGLALGALYGTGAALVQGTVSKVKREEQVRAALSACQAALAPPAPPAPPARAPGPGAPPRDGAAELRALGVEAPR